MTSLFQYKCSSAIIELLFNSELYISIRNLVNIAVNNQRISTDPNFV
jgi:hypothetical protein